MHSTVLSFSGKQNPYVHPMAFGKNPLGLSNATYLGDGCYYIPPQAKRGNMKTTDNGWKSHAHNLSKNVEKFKKVNVEEDNFFMKKAAEEIDAALQLYNDKKGAEAYQRAKAVRAALLDDTMKKIANGEKKVQALLKPVAPQKYSRLKKIGIAAFLTVASAGTIAVLASYLWG